MKLMADPNCPNCGFPVGNPSTLTQLTSRKYLLYNCTRCGYTFKVPEEVGGTTEDSTPPTEYKKLLD